MTRLDHPVFQTVSARSIPRPFHDRFELANVTCPFEAGKAGRLSIAVIPFGDIWIDGQPWGPAPLKNEPLRPGTYRISAGRGKPERTRTIKIKAGERRAVEFDLIE